MKTGKQAIATNKESNLQAEALTDLPVTAEQAQQATAGSISLNFTKIEHTYTGMGSANEI